MGNDLTRPRGVARVLIHHFFERFFGNEALSPDADALTNIGPLLGLLATPWAFAILVVLPLTVAGWGLVTFRYWFVALSMIAISLVVVLYVVVLIDKQCECGADYAKQDGVARRRISDISGASAWLRYCLPYRRRPRRGEPHGSVR